MAGVKGWSYLGPASLYVGSVQHLPVLLGSDLNFDLNRILIFSDVIAHHFQRFGHEFGGEFSAQDGGGRYLVVSASNLI